MDRPRRQLPSLQGRWRRGASSEKHRAMLGGANSAPQSGHSSPSNRSLGSSGGGGSGGGGGGGGAGALPPRPRSTTLRRVKKAFFDRPDSRVDEDLRSTKRRIIQIWRQNENAPIQCTLGFRSRTGWEPIRAVRENQDCIVALLPWGPQGQYSLFAALDGHGRAGHLCSMFVAQRVISYLSRSLNAPTVDVAYALHRAIDYAEQRLESSQVNIDCEVSGSTGVFVLIDGSKLYCANVGDSRAVLGRKLPMLSQKFPPSAFQTSMLSNIPSARSDDISPGSITSGNNDLDINAPCGYMPVPLSFDHKPEREDEKKRVIAAGGRVDAWQGVDVGAERVWLPDSRTPGLAVTRSFGDNIVKAIGVTATPEIYSLPLSDSDSFIVIASDGVFEFVSNYEVISIVSRHRDAGSPQSAAEEIVKISADRWMDDDSVIDDISCIVVFLDVKEPATDTPCKPVLVSTNIQLSTSVNTPMSTQLPAYPSSSNVLFGQYSASSSDLASQNVSRRMLSKSGLPIITSRPDVGIVRTDSHTSATAVNDIVRRYAERLEQDNSKSDLKRHSAPRSDLRGSALGLNSGSAHELFASSKSNTSFTSQNVELAGLTPGPHIIPGKVQDHEQGGDPSVIFQGSTSGFNDADVSEDSERFEDAEEDVQSSEITKVAPAEDKIILLDEDDDEKFADADTLVPIESQNVIRRQEVSFHRQPPEQVPPPHEQKYVNIPKRPASSNCDRPEAFEIGATEDPGSGQPTPSSSNEGFFFNSRKGRKGLRPLKGLRIGSDFGVRRGTNDSESANPTSTSGRLRRRRAGRRPQSANSNGIDFEPRR